MQIISFEISKKELRAYEKLKPCPLCRRKRIKVYRNSFNCERNTRITCKCGLVFFGDTNIEKAIAKWNRREEK